MTLSQTISWCNFSPKHQAYIDRAMYADFCVAEGAIRSGKTIDSCYIAYKYLIATPDRFHLASGSTLANAKMNIGICNGYGLEALFRGRCRWGKYRDNEALFLNISGKEKIVLFVGGGKADSYKKILGYSIGLWIATEINEHYDGDDSRTSFVKVALGRQVAAVMPMRIWDLNPSSPHAPIYSQYIDHYRDLDRPGYLYEHFTIDDNWSLSPERREEIKRDYDPNSIWYKRDILGQRVIAEGLIYESFASHPEAWGVDLNDLRERYYDTREHRWRFEYLNFGVDYGGNGSAHAFVAIAITEDLRVVVLKTKRLPAKNMTVEVLTQNFLAFAAEVRAIYGDISASYCDSAEQTIINTFRQAADFPVVNALKGKIIDRIRATELLMTSHRLCYVIGECDSLVQAWMECLWDPKDPGSWVRLDDGSTDIDSNDAFEYSIERFIPMLIQAIEGEAA